MELLMCRHWLGIGRHSSDVNVRLQMGSVMDTFITHILELKNIIPYLLKCKMRFSP
jgi:hypothetical protein